jgi:hypothetical protein
MCLRRVGCICRRDGSWTHRKRVCGGGTSGSSRSALATRMKKTTRPHLRHCVRCRLCCGRRCARGVRHKGMEWWWRSHTRGRRIRRQTLIHHERGRLRKLGLPATASRSCRCRGCKGRRCRGRRRYRGRRWWWWSWQRQNRRNMRCHRCVGWNVRRMRRRCFPCHFGVQAAGMLRR